LFKVAKERIYKIVDGSRPTRGNGNDSGYAVRGEKRPPNNANVRNPVKKLVPILEENPKWRLLHQVLSEI